MNKYERENVAQRTEGKQHMDKCLRDMRNVEEKPITFTLSLISVQERK